MGRQGAPPGSSCAEVAVSSSPFPCTLRGAGSAPRAASTLQTTLASIQVFLGSLRLTPWQSMLGVCEK